jgi:hypothetical protein
MSLTQRKDRVVLFRLTEHEHQALEALCPARVGRSLSEFVGVEVLNPARSMDIAPLRELVGSMERRLLNPEGIDGESVRRIESLCGDQPVDGSCAKEVGQA